jgi:hypothetical protein
MHEMTGDELISSILKRQRVDRIALFGHLWEDA